jgi:CRP-like cAMP-binding protein
MQSTLKTPSSELMGALRRHPLWAGASDHAVRTVLRCAVEQRFEPGQQIFGAKDGADSMLLLIEGAARMFYPGPQKTSDITVVLFAAPAAFGDAEALVGLPWYETVEALVPSRVLRINIHAYLNVLKLEPELAARHYRDIAARFSVAIRRAQNTHFGEVHSRLIALLVSYANSFGRVLQDGESVCIHYALTRDALAQQIGSNRRSVARALAHLQGLKLIRRQGRKYVLPSITALLNQTVAQAALSYSSGDARKW